VVQWLRDGLGLIESSEDVEALALTEKDSGDVFLVPAFAGLGAPEWDAYARGALIGITRGTTKGHLARAALEGIAYQVADLVSALEADAGFKLDELRVDGGASANDTLMQFQADILGVSLIRPRMTETTAMGAAFLAGLATGVWSHTSDLTSLWAMDRRFEPAMPESEARARRERWHQAVARCRDWAPHES
jgi:glycerol kinase